MKGLKRDISRDSVSSGGDTQSVPSLLFSYLESWTVRIREVKHEQCLYRREQMFTH